MGVLKEIGDFCKQYKVLEYEHEGIKMTFSPAAFISNEVMTPELRQMPKQYLVDELRRREEEILFHSA